MLSIEMLSVEMKFMTHYQTFDQKLVSEFCSGAS